MGEAECCPDAARPGAGGGRWGHSQDVCGGCGTGNAGIEGPGGLGVSCERVGSPREFTQGQEWPGVLVPSGSFVPRGLCPGSIAQVRSYKLGAESQDMRARRLCGVRVEPEEEVEGNGATPGVLSERQRPQVEC